MKRTGFLFDSILARENFRLAFHRARKGKRGRLEVCRFQADLDRNLDRLREELAGGAYPFGRFTQFVIWDPKERIITAPCFEERVIHHAIMNVCEPYFDRWLIADSYACRKGKGRDAAVTRARQFSWRYDFFLKADIRKYFDSISHAKLLEKLASKLKDRPLLETFERILRAFRGGGGRGVPIGSLTSQHFANFFLGTLDRMVTANLPACGYVRYMDDLVLWSNDRKEIARIADRMKEFLSRELELEFKVIPYVNRTGHGLDFLGYRISTDAMKLNPRSRTRFRRKLRGMKRAFYRGELTEQELQDRATSLVNFTRPCGKWGWRFRRSVLSWGEGERP